MKHPNLSAFFKNSAVSLAWALFFFFLLELFTRLYLFGTNSFHYEKMKSITRLGNSGLIQRSPYPEILFELKPNLNTYFRRTLFQTNSVGLRDKEYPLEKGERVFRVAVVGASVTMGAGVEIQKVFHSLLEDRLNRESSGVRYEFINFGVGGYGLDQCVATLKYKALPYQPDLVLFSAVLKTIDDDARAGFKVKPPENGFFESHFLKWCWYALRSRIIGEPAKMKQEPGYTINWEKRDRLYAELAQIGKDRHIPICIFAENLTRSRGTLKQLTRKHGFLWIDTAAEFQKMGVPFTPIDSMDIHPGPDMHKILADLLYDDLKKNRLIEPHPAA